MLATRSRHKKSLTRTEKSLLENQRSLKSQESQEIENQENPNNSTTKEDLEAEEKVPTEDLLAASMTQPPVQEIPKDRATTRKARQESVPAKTGPGSIRMPQANL